MNLQTESGTSELPGFHCVDSFIAPRIENFFRRNEIARPQGLQIEPDLDAPENEAVRLRELGYPCLVALASWRSYRANWQQSPVGVDALHLPFPDASFHFIVTGAFARLASTPLERSRLASELFRVCASPGAVLMTCSNRFCPVDLIGKRFHTVFDRASTDLYELERVFKQRSGFRAVSALNLAGHFEWRSLQRRFPWVARTLESYLRWVTTPQRRTLYAGPLNPVLAVLVEK